MCVCARAGVRVCVWVGVCVGVWVGGCVGVWVCECGCVSVGVFFCVCVCVTAVDELAFHWPTSSVWVAECILMGQEDFDPEADGRVRVFVGHRSLPSLSTDIFGP